MNLNISALDCIREIGTPIGDENCASSFKRFSKSIREIRTPIGDENAIAQAIGKPKLLIREIGTPIGDENRAAMIP